MDITLDDLEVIATLGVGGFGRVEMVKVTVQYVQNVQNVKDFNEVHHCCFAVSQPAKHCICSKVFEKAGNTFIV